MAKTVAEMLVERVVERSVNTILGFLGDGIHGVPEVVRTNQSKAQFIQVRHVKAVAFARLCISAVSLDRFYYGS